MELDDECVRACVAQLSIDADIIDVYRKLRRGDASPRVLKLYNSLTSYQQSGQTDQSDQSEQSTDGQYAQTGQDGQELTSTEHMKNTDTLDGSEKVQTHTFQNTRNGVTAEELTCPRQLAESHRIDAVPNFNSQRSQPSLHQNSTGAQDQPSGHRIQAQVPRNSIRASTATQPVLKDARTRTTQSLSSATLDSDYQRITSSVHMTRQARARMLNASVIRF